MADSDTNGMGSTASPTQFLCDLNAGVAFFLDVVVNMFLLSGLLIGVFGFPADIVFGKIIPGGIAGILFGNLAMHWLTKKTFKETGNENLTSIPLGLDLPSLFGMVFFIIGPVYVIGLNTMTVDEAANNAWVIGMASILWMAVIKFVLSFLGRLMQHELPQMALIGAMAGIATVWLGAEAIYGIFELPEVGILAFSIMIFSLIAGHKLPFGMPGAIVAILAGTLLYYILAFGGMGGSYTIPSAPEVLLNPVLPVPTVAGVFAMFGSVTNYLGIIFPFALLIAASSVNVVTGARVMGDEFHAGKVVRLDAAASAISALFGGVVQTTPYFGHATYKRMGARTNYSLGVALITTVGGFLGVIELASVFIPAGVLKPILVVVASDILRLAFTGGDVRHAPALLFAIVPAILNYAHSKVSALYSVLDAQVTAALSSDWMAGYILLGAMARGYILTSLMWATLVVWIIDGKFIRAACAAFAAAVLTEFGIIHSILSSSGMYLPWAIPEMGGYETLPHTLAIGYSVAGVTLLLLSYFKEEERSE